MRKQVSTTVTAWSSKSPSRQSRAAARRRLVRSPRTERAESRYVAVAGSRTCACWQSEPQWLASATGGPSRGGAATGPDARVAAGKDKQQRCRGAGRDSCICPAEQKTARRHGLQCRSPRYAQSCCPRSLSACKHPNPNSGRKRSQARRVGAGGVHSGSRRPGRRAAPSSKGIVTSAATASALPWLQ